jgi:hypothetical protein
MSRLLSSGVQSAIVASEVSPIVLFEAEFASGWLRIWSGIGDLSWSSGTWTGAGTLFSVSSVEETADTSAKGITVTLSGIPADMISLVLSDMRQGKSGKVYLGFLDSNGAIISDPVLAFEGRLDIPALQEEAESATISISYESRLIDLQRTRESRYTNEDQQRAYPGDKAFEFVPNLQEIQINWGRSDSSGKSKPTA